MKEIRTLQPYNFGELPPEMKEKAEKMIADISPIGEVNEGTVDAIEAWSREDVLVLMRAMYNEALRQPRPIPSDVQEAAKAYEDSLDYHECMSQWPSVGYAAGMLAERERMMKEAVEAELWRHNGTTLRVNAVLPKDSPVRLGDKVSVIIIKKEK